ncbi:hypothetical protein EDC01DRAFT_242762 [Geopyxis carbonaria]|nr:hypothetical protein EDC01DRAFT_242762 [Geopyxis carbonaria]
MKLHNSVPVYFLLSYVPSPHLHPSAFTSVPVYQISSLTTNLSVPFCFRCLERPLVRLSLLLIITGNGCESSHVVGFSSCSSLSRSITSPNVETEVGRSLPPDLRGGGAGAMSTGREVVYSLMETSSRPRMEPGIMRGAGGGPRMKGVGAVAVEGPGVLLLGPFMDTMCGGGFRSRALWVERRLWRSTDCMMGTGGPGYDDKGTLCWVTAEVGEGERDGPGSGGNVFIRGCVWNGIGGGGDVAVVLGIDDRDSSCLSLLGLPIVEDGGVEIEVVGELQEISLKDGEENWLDIFYVESGLLGYCKICRFPEGM